MTAISTTTKTALVIAVVALVSCGSEDSTLETVASTLPELDGVVVTVAPSDLRGEPIVIGDSVPDDAEVTPISEIVEESNDEDSDRTTDGDESGDEESEGETDDGLNPLGGDDPEDKLMPDVVCMNLQDAQDEIQDRGVFFSRSEDATGDGRRQLWDRNWTVVAQSPSAGEPIGEGDAVLSVVKNDETDDC